MSKIPRSHIHHWPYIYAKRRRRQQVLGINAKQMAWSQIISLVGSVVAGVLLEANKVELGLIAGAFLVLPGVFDLDGSIGAALSAKINHHLENPKANAVLVFLKSVGFALLISALAGLVVALVGACIATAFFDADFGQIFLLTEQAILLSAVIGFPLIGAMSVLFRQFNVNPDDVVGPIESSVFDILTVLTMVMVIGWLT
jgi:cation transporter-like permease